MTDAATTAPERGSRKVRIGKVISNKMQKSIVVAIERRIPHPLYKKYYKRTSTLMAHDEQQAAKIGDLVKVAETRPLSARKRWRLVEILEKAK
jgi:small subunit ribosomal protein S17